MKTLFVSVALIASLPFFGCGGSEEKKQEENMPSADTSKGVSAITNDSSHRYLAYICPCGGCPEVRESNPGNCPKCDMELVQEKK